MSSLVFDLTRELYEAQQRSMASLLESWDKELEAQARAFEESKKRLAVQDAEEQARSAAAESYLRGQVAQAMAGYDVSISVPSGVQVASDLIQAPSEVETQVLATKLLDHQESLEPLQRSLACALGNGFLPHPGQVAERLDQVGLDRPWAIAFQTLAQGLNALDAKATPHPQLRAFAGAERLNLLHQEVGLIRAYGGGRLAAAVLRPEGLAPLERVPPVATRATVDHSTLNRVLNNLFK